MQGSDEELSSNELGSAGWKCWPLSEKADEGLPWQSVKQVWGSMDRLMQRKSLGMKKKNLERHFMLQLLHVSLKLLLQEWGRRLLFTC